MENQDYIFTFIDAWLMRGLNYRYSAQSPLVSFFKSSLTIDIKGRYGQFNLKNINDSSECSSSRFPQTRIYLREFLNPKFRIKIIEFFKDTFILIYPLENQNLSIFFIEFANDLQALVGSQLHSASDLKLEIQNNQQQIIWLFPKEEKRQWADLEEHLNKILNKEHRLHPLSQLRLSDQEAMKNIDTAWSELESIGPNREVLLQNSEDIQDANFCWLQELYLHFGWYKELEAAYETIPTERNSNLIDRCKQRFLSVKKNKKYVLHKNTQETNFLDQYFSGNVQPDQIQDFWQHIHYPAYWFKLKREMQNNPDKFIAFALLVQQGNFFWQARFQKFLQEFLPKNRVQLVKLLLMLKSLHPYYSNGQTVYFNPVASEQSVQEMVHIPEGNVFSQIRHNKKLFTKIKLGNILDFKIDCAVKLGFESQIKRLTVLPALLFPPTGKPELTFAEIEIEAQRVSVPLAWAQFELSFNGVRIKFLRKKNRFQLSVRAEKGIKNIRIDNQQIQFEKSKYAKIYLSVLKKTSQIEAQTFNEWGAYPSATQVTYLKGWAIDVFQILHEQVQITEVDAKKSYAILTNKLPLKQNIFLNAGKKYRLSCRGCSTRELEIDFRESFIAAFLYTPAEQLQNRCIVFCDENRLEIAAMFYNQLGFYPVVKAISNFDPAEAFFTIIIESSFNKQSVSEKEGYQIIYVSPGKKIKGILIHPKKVEQVLNSHFMSHTN